jgi:hypothetical protein
MKKHGKNSRLTSPATSGILPGYCRVLLRDYYPIQEGKSDEATTTVTNTGS